MKFRNLDAINNSLHLLLQHIHAPELQKWRNFEPRATRYPNQASELAFTQEVAQSVAKHYSLENITFIVELTDSLESKANVEIRDSKEIFIRYHRAGFIDNAILTPTLAHEIAHIFLDKKNLRFQSTLENEVLTDVTTIMLGFGELYLSAQDEVKLRISSTEEQTSQFRLGYLTPDEMGYVLAHRCCLTGEHAYKSITSKTGKKAFARGQKLFRKLQKEIPYKPSGWFSKKVKGSHKSKQSESIEFDCLVCKQSLRIPKNGKKLLVTCPNCRLKIPCYT